MTDRNGGRAPKLSVENAGAEEPVDGAAGAARDAEPAAQVKPEPEGARGAGARGFQGAAMGFVEGVGKCAWSYADAHPHTVLYGAIGLLLAVLILLLGLWQTLIIAIFTGVGAGIGMLRDANGSSRDSGARTFMSRFFGGR